MLTFAPCFHPFLFSIPGAGTAMVQEEEEVESDGDSFGERDDDSAGSGSEDGGEFNTGDRKGRIWGGFVEAMAAPSSLCARFWGVGIYMRL